jgi:pyruvyltransferase
MKIQTHYFNPPVTSPGHHNFGDMLVPIILRFLTNNKYNIEYVIRDIQGKLLCIGSELASGVVLQENDVIFGYGAKLEKPIDIPKGVEILSVRGPLTRELINIDNVPEIYGDPAILMPLIYSAGSAVCKYRIGIIPHYVDKPLFNHLLLSDDTILIDINQSPYDVIQQILSCDIILSTSLHGAIVAEAYGKKVVWLQASNKIGGFIFKWLDYLVSTGRPDNIQPVIYDGVENPNEYIKYALPPPSNLSFLQQGLLNTWKENEQYILSTCQG